MGEKTDRRELVAFQSGKKVAAWIIGSVGSIGGAVLVMINLDVCAPAWQSKAQAAATYETKVDADKAHLTLEVRINTVEDEHDEQMKVILNTKANVDRLLGRFNVEPAPEVP